MLSKSELWGGWRRRSVLGRAVLLLLLLLCEIVVSRLCSSLINMVDAFHTLFLLLHISLLHPVFKCPVPSPPRSPSRRSNPSSPEPSSALFHGDSGGRARLLPFGRLVSALLLASLSVSVTLDILSHVLQPHPMQHPLLATVVGGMSLLLNVTMLAATCGRLQDRKPESLGSGSKDIDQTKATEDKADAGIPSQALERSLPDGSLMFCNPATSSVLDPGGDFLRPRSQMGQKQQDGELQQACSQQPTVLPLLDISVLQVTGPSAESPAYDASAGLSDKTAMAHATPVTPVIPWPSFHGGSFFQVLFIVVRTMLSPILVLTNGLLLLLSGTDCLQPQGGCHSFVYLDPAFSLVAVLVLLATALPEVHRHGLLLLQGSPPRLCVSELGRRIAGVPGVESFHDLHVWQLTEVFLVASVHVHVGEGQARCGHVIGAVTEVLRGAGVTHCTVQPEILPEGGGAAACSLACRKECADKMCCSPAHLAPPDVETASSQDLVFENTFL
ncbi:zinc transporter 1 isoform X2 [Denticeps clupeoides]|nr:zinc transporter 1-like isoform X2 [Denticeps clupeoides]XP_028818075.1 zinc transporter 1-like isoform X2 [Denticeps clupeoides]